MMMMTTMMMLILHAADGDDDDDDHDRDLNYARWQRQGGKITQKTVRCGGWAMDFWVWYQSTSGLSTS